MTPINGPVQPPKPRHGARKRGKVPSKLSCTVVRMTTRPHRTAESIVNPSLVLVPSLVRDFDLADLAMQKRPKKFQRVLNLYLYREDDASMPGCGIWADQHEEVRVTRHHGPFRAVVSTRYQA
jgi:hypothetical protein